MTSKRGSEKEYRGPKCQHKAVPESHFGCSLFVKEKPNFFIITKLVGFFYMSHMPPGPSKALKRHMSEQQYRTTFPVDASLFKIMTCPSRSCLPAKNPLDSQWIFKGNQNCSWKESKAITKMQCNSS